MTPKSSPNQSNYVISYTYYDDNPTETHLLEYEIKNRKIVRHDIDCTEFSTYEPLSGFVTLNNGLYYFGLNNKAKRFEEGVVVARFDLTTHKVTVLKTIDEVTYKSIAIFLIEGRLHVIIFHVEARVYELIEFSEDNGDEIFVRKFGQIDIVNESSSYEAFSYHDWSYDKANDSLIGRGQYYDYPNYEYYDFEVSVSLDSGEIILTKGLAVGD